MHVVDKGIGIQYNKLVKLKAHLGQDTHVKSRVTDSTDKQELNELGLLICKNIVEKARGSIRCYSQGFNKGATFMFSMRMEMPRLENNLTVVQELPSMELQSSRDFISPRRRLMNE